MTNIQKLHQEASAAVAQQSALIAAVAGRKQTEAKDAIEREIPVAAANDTQELTKDVAEEDKQLEAALSRSTAEAQEALQEIKDKTATAVNMSTIRTVRDVEKEAEEGAMYISNHSIQMEQEADALAKEATGAANFSQEAAKNSALWVKELPTEDAAEAVKTAEASAAESIKLRHEYEDVKRIAKLAGNLALDTINVAQQAVAQTNKAQEEATKTLEQAAQNAQLLHTVLQQTTKASQTALGVVKELP